MSILTSLCVKVKLYNHDNGQDDDLEEHVSHEQSQITQEEVDSYSSEDEHNVPFAELGRSNFYYGKNLCKCSETPPNVRVDERKNPLSYWNKLFGEETFQQILTWSNKKQH